MTTLWMASVCGQKNRHKEFQASSCGKK